MKLKTALKYTLVNLLLLVAFQGFSQSETQVIFTAFEQKDRTFEKGEELFLRNEARKEQVIYHFDSTDQIFRTRKYMIDNYYDIFDGDTTVEQKLNRRYKRWRNEFSLDYFEALQADLALDVDSLEKDLSILHTSHHYLNLYITIIQSGDTSVYRKTKPFEYLNPWFIGHFNGVLNPEIDRKMLSLLPRRFLGREKLRVGAGIEK